VQESSAFVAGMVDIAPTIITLTGGTPPDIVNGHSFENMIKEKWMGLRQQGKHLER